MSRDPNQLFVMNAITRRGIMEDLQDLRTACGYKHPNDPQEIAEDDDRLTDEICQEYADALGQIDFDYSEDSADEASHNAACIALEAMGYVQEDDDGDSERDELIVEIRQAETQLALKRARLMQLDKLNEPDYLQTPGSAF